MVFQRDGALGASVHGVGVSILAFQASVPGSSPGERNIFSFFPPAPAASFSGFLVRFSFAFRFRVASSLWALCGRPGRVV